MKVLVAEDQEVMREMIKDFFVLFGHSVTCCDNGFKAWESWSKERPDIIISDIHMPIMTGVELLKKVKKVAPDFPVILITGVSVEEAKIEAEKYKVDEFVRKPFAVPDLVKLAEKYKK